MEFYGYTVMQYLALPVYIQRDYYDDIDRFVYEYRGNYFYVPQNIYVIPENPREYDENDIIKYARYLSINDLIHTKHRFERYIRLRFDDRLIGG